LLCHGTGRSGHIKPAYVERVELERADIVPVAAGPELGHP